jgi:FkbM family methyltransferase
MLKSLAELIQEVEPNLRFSLFEIGSRMMRSQPEPFYEILDFFPGSKIFGFEVERELCAQMNEQARDGVVFHPCALGEREEERSFYVTQAPMCSSLYEPNPAYIDLYNNIHYASLKQEIKVRTTSLDYFSDENSVHFIDFIKIDIQGAELDVFRGGIKSLSKCLFIVTEVGFVDLYKNQPLFGDVSGFLRSQGLMFHKFLNIGWRSLKPILLNNDINHGSQMLWADAIFCRDINFLNELSSQQLLKLSVLSFLNASPDLTYFCLSLFDKRTNTDLAGRFLSINSRSSGQD